MKKWFVLLTALLGLVQPGGTAGLIILHDEGFWLPRPPWPAPPPRPLPPPRPAPPIPPPVALPMETTFTKADIKIKDQIATTSIEQEFYNPNARQVEGTFLFPVPRGAHVSKFTMEINGRPVEAELLAADKARGIYEDIVRKLKDPALLEYAGRDLFKVRIFPIEPNARKRITLSYSQVLKADGGLVNFLFPLNTEKYSATPLKSVSVKLELETRHPLKAIYSPSHKVEIKRHSPTRATVGYEASDVKPDTDLQLFYTQEDGELGLNLLTYKNANEDGYFLLLASPGAELENTKTAPKDVAFVLDTSGSMAGAKLVQAKKALAFCVENLNASDHFEIMRFATEVEPLFDRLVEATPDNRLKAQTFINELKPIGGTAIDDALRKALALRPEKGNRPFVVIFLTDGRPTVGNTDENQIVKNVNDAGKGGVRVFCFGIGNDVNTHLLDRITEDTKAYSQYVLPEEDIEVKVSAFFTKIKEPALTNLKLTFPESVRVTKLYPSPLPDLFKGEQLVIAGRYAGKADGAIQIEGMVNGETRKFSYDAKFGDTANDHDFIPRLWATRRVGYLLDEIRLRGESRELKDEVTELARKYSIVTPYTAYLILEDERQRGVPVASRSLPQLEQNVLVGREAAEVYNYFRDDKDGARAVAGARSFQRLKMAEASSDAIVLGNAETLRVAPAAAAPTTSGLAGGSFNGGRLSAAKPVSQAAIAANEPARLVAARQYADQSQFVSGRTFFQNGSQWIDAGVQKAANARRVRVQFDSPEYFELLKQHPTATRWFSMGRNLQLLLGDAIYEIYE